MCSKQLVASEFAKQFERSLLTRFMTTAPSDRTDNVINRVFRSELNSYLETFGFAKIKRSQLTVSETCTSVVLSTLKSHTAKVQTDSPMNAEAGQHEQSALTKVTTTVFCRFSELSEKSDHRYWQLEITHKQLNYAICLRIERHSQNSENTLLDDEQSLRDHQLTPFFFELSDHSAFFKSLWAFASQRKLPHLISEYHKALDWRGVFSSYWTERFLTQQVTRLRILAMFSIDSSALADAVNPLLLAIWQQWRLRRSSAFKRKLWQAVEEISQCVSLDETDAVPANNFGLKYDNVGLLSTLLTLFTDLKTISDAVLHKPNSPLPIETDCSVLNSEKSQQQFTQLLACCMTVNHHLKRKSAASSETFRRSVLRLMLKVCGAYLRKQCVISDSEKSVNSVRRLSRANLYVWLIHSILSHQACAGDAGKASACLQNTCDCSFSHVEEQGRLFEDLCFLTEATGRYMLFRSGDYPFEGKPIKLAKTLLRIIDFHSTHVLRTKLPSSLLQLLVDSFEAEHKFSALKDASQHVQHLSDLYLFGQFLASDDFNVEKPENHQIDNKPVQQAYAIASLFHDIGMLEDMQHYDIQWPAALEKHAYIEQFKNIKFIDSTEAEDIQAYEYFPYQEHAFTSASLVHQEVKRFNKHIAQYKDRENSQQLKMAHPIRPAVRAILFHSMCYLPSMQHANSTADTGNITAMLLAMTDAIFTWRPSTTSIGNSHNIMCGGFGPAIQADLARFDDKQLEIIGDSVFLIRESAIGESIQYVLKLIQSFGRLSFAINGWNPVILLEVSDKDLLLKELDDLTECLYHEVCDGVSEWLELQQAFNQWTDECMATSTRTSCEHNESNEQNETAQPSKSRTEADNRARQNLANVDKLFNTLKAAKVSNPELNEEEIKHSTIYIESNNKVLGNYDVIKFLQLPQVKDFIRHRSKFH